MSEKVSEYWLIEGATRIIACKVDPREIPGNENCVVLAHTIDKQAYDRLAEINKVLSEALEFYGKEELWDFGCGCCAGFTELTDIQHKKAVEALAKAKEMVK